MIKYYKIVYIIISLLFILAYFMGALEIIGIEQYTSRLTIQLLIVVLFIFSLLKIHNHGKFIIDSGLLIGLVGLFITLLVSFLINDYSFKYLLLFLKESIFPFIFFIALINAKIPRLYLKKLLEMESMAY